MTCNERTGDKGVCPRQRLGASCHPCKVLPSCAGIWACIRAGVVLCGAADGGGGAGADRPPGAAAGDACLQLPAPPSPAPCPLPCPPLVLSSSPVHTLHVMTGRTPSYSQLLETPVFNLAGPRILPASLPPLVLCFSSVHTLHVTTGRSASSQTPDACYLGSLVQRAYVKFCSCQNRASVSLLVTTDSMA